MQLAAPTVSPSVSECSSFVRVRGQLTHSYVEVFEATASGTSVVAQGPARGPDQFFGLERSLSVPARLFALQSRDGDSSPPGPESTWGDVQPAPRNHHELGNPRILGRARACGRCLWLDRALPGASLRIRGGGDALGSAEAHDGQAVVDLSLRAVAALETLEVEVTACGMTGPWQPLATAENPPVSQGDRLSPPTLGAPLYECERWVVVSGVCEGARVTLQRTNGPDASWCSPVSEMAVPVDPPLSENEIIVARQQMPECGLSSQASVPVRVLPGASLPPPVLRGPVCEDAPSLEVSGLRQGAVVRIRHDGEEIAVFEAPEQTYRVPVRGLRPGGLLKAEQALVCANGLEHRSVATTLHVDARLARLRTPVLVGPLNSCMTRVRVENVDPGAIVDIHAVELGVRLGHRVATDDEWVEVRLRRPLSPGDHLFAVQRGCGESDPSGWVEIEAVPDRVPEPWIIPPVDDTMRMVTVADVVPGAHVDVLVDHVVWGSATASVGMVEVRLARALVAGQEVRARQQVCTHAPTDGPSVGVTHNPAGGPTGTWHLKTWEPAPADPYVLSPATLSVNRRSSGDYGGSMVDVEGVSRLDRLTWDGLTFIFRANSMNRWRWFRLQVVEGVLTGRATPPSPSPEERGALEFTTHVTGWNADYLDRDIVPRVFDLMLDDGADGRRATLRIDRGDAGGLVGRFKIYGSATRIRRPERGDYEGDRSIEGPEYDLEDLGFDGANLSFVRRHPAGGWTEEFWGWLGGRSISGTYVHDGARGSDSLPQSGFWRGTRAGVLGYGLVPRSRTSRSAWQSRTRRQLRHVLMAGDPAPLNRLADRAQVGPYHSLPPFERVISRDDERPAGTARRYQVAELNLSYELPNPHGAAPIVRRSHGFVAVPNTPPPPQGYRAVLVLNGHWGSAHFTFGQPVERYWYGDGFAERGYVALCIDVSHRPPTDTPFHRDAARGDRPERPDLNGPHPAIRAEGMDSDWVEDGERAWTAMRAAELLLAGVIPGPRGAFAVDSRCLVVTGLSMGGEVTSIVGALDERFRVVIPAGFSPDLGLLSCASHGCVRWQFADFREYIDTSDYHALTAPRMMVVETGIHDDTYSGSALVPHFASEKQVARRSRAAYGEEAHHFVHYLHSGGHIYRTGGDARPFRHEVTSLERGVRVPTAIDPATGTDPANPLSWQASSVTRSERLPGMRRTPMLFDLIEEFCLGRR